MLLRQYVYRILVNKQPGISYRYHKLHDGSTGMLKIVSWVYLLWLNVAYYFLFFRFLGSKPEAVIYEEKRLPVNKSESETHFAEYQGLCVDVFAERLSHYDVISFDIFDTLIFRPFSDPTDLFYLLGGKLGIMNFNEIRMEQEWRCRQECYKKNGHYEVTLSQIWNRIEREVGISAKEGIEEEQTLELSLCYANPFMLKVFKRLKQSKKKVILISDMYLSMEFIKSLLKKCGIEGYDELYVSCEYGKNKASGTLYEYVKKLYPAGRTLIHVGDNMHSDVRMAEKTGFRVLYYPNVNRMALSYRPYDMSPIIGGAYRGIVDNHIYCGGISGKARYPFSVEYEYGFIYGGLFVLGYCGFIHDYYKKNGVDKVLFLSRDGDILKRVYDYLYPQDHTVYVYWSRKAAVKLMADEDKHDYFRRFIYHKVNQGITIAEILHSMELDELAEQLKDLRREEKLTDKNENLLIKFIEGNWAQVIDTYVPQITAAKKYYSEVLSGCKKVVAIDIGWAGSGALSLAHLSEKVWNLNCTVIGAIAGTNTVHNSEPNASELFLQDGRLISYLYSQQNNRDLLKKHDPNKDYNVFWELLLSSPTPQFAGFYEGKYEKPEGERQYLGDLDITLLFGKYDYNRKGIQEIQRGILDFAQEYHDRFEGFPYMFNISGRDAYAPMLVAASHNERYLKMVEKRFQLEIMVN